MKSKISILVFATTSCFLSQHAAAYEVGLGLGATHTHSVYKEVSEETTVVPVVYLKSDRLLINLGEASYRITDNENYQLNLEASLRFDGYDSSDSDFLSGMDDREMGLDLGFSFSTMGDWGELQLQMLADVSNKSDGFETTMTYQYPFNLNALVIIPNAGLSVSSHKLVDYYYGVTAEEALTARPFYEGRSATDYFVGTNIIYSLTQNTDLLFSAEIRTLGNEKTNSPLVEHHARLNVLAAYLYKF